MGSPMRWSTQRTGQHCWGESVWHLSPQAYVNRFKFQSITADDTLEFFLEYFPELKEKGVDSIPGQHSAILAREQGLPLYSPTPAGVRAAHDPRSLCTLVCVFYWRCCCCQPGSVRAGTDSTGQLGSGPGLGMWQLSPVSPCSALGCCFMECPWLSLVSLVSTGIRPSLARDPGLAGAFHAGAHPAGGAGADTHKHSLSPCLMASPH